MIKERPSIGDGKKTNMPAETLESCSDIFPDLGSWLVLLKIRVATQIDPTRPFFFPPGCQAPTFHPKKSDSISRQEGVGACGEVVGPGGNSSFREKITRVLSLL